MDKTHLQITTTAEMPHYKMAEHRICQMTFHLKSVIDLIVDVQDVEMARQCSNDDTTEQPANQERADSKCLIIHR